ncbi:MAG: hypothetical protein HLUCCO16_20260 [Phormidium sp. OSCR]|nr:MAG: hypothetical protein HLUCCO16_20260 [Phormidium sp. OSCR]
MVWLPGMNDAFGQVEQEWSKPNLPLMPEHILPAFPLLPLASCLLPSPPCSLLLVIKRSLSLYLPILKVGRIC